MLRALFRQIQLVGFLLFGASPGIHNQSDGDNTIGEEGPEIQPMVMPMFRPMPHWIPGIIARTRTPYMVIRSSTLPIIMRTEMLYSSARRQR